MAERQTISSYAPCPLCLAWTKKIEFYKHQRTCPCKVIGGPKISLKQSISLRYEDTNLSRGSIQVIAGLRDGDVPKAIKNDTALVEFLNMSTETMRSNEQIRTVRGHMRLLGRFLVHAQELIPGATMTTLFLETDFKDVVKIANSVPGNPNTVDNTRKNIIIQLKKFFRSFKPKATDMYDLPENETLKIHCQG